MKSQYFIIAFLFTLTLNAQDFKFGDVSKEELKQEYHELDSAANAAVLYRKETISFNYEVSQGNFTQYRDVHERIKIYNKEGYDWATKLIYLYSGDGSNKEKVSGLKGYTYNLNNGKIEKEKLRNDNIFEEEYTEFYDITKITLPNIQDGCIIEYTYKIRSPFYAIDDIEIQKTIPINKLDVRIATPQYLSYNRWMNPRASYIFNVNDSRESKSVTFTNSQRVGVQGTNFSQSRSEYFDNIININEENIPALKEEAYAGSMNNYISKFSMEINAFLNDYGGTEKSFATNWEKVSKTIYESDKFGNQLDRSNFYDDDVDAITEGIEDPFQLAFILQEYVKSKVSWNGNNGYVSYSSTKKAYNDGVGNVGDINLLLTSMLRYKGVNAYPVLVSTRDNGIPLFPTRKGFNYVICLVQNGDDYALLDATEKYSQPNVLPRRTMNWQGRLIKEDGSSTWIPIRSSTASTETTSLNAKIESDLSVNGNIRRMLSSYSALNYRNGFAKVSEEDHIKSLEKDNGSIEVTDLKFENAEDITKPVKLTYNYTLEDGIDEIGDKIYFSPLLFFKMEESPFKLETRQYPIDFTMPMEDKYLINILLPDGYAVESLPESQIFEFKQGAARYTYISKQNGKYLQFSINFELKNSMIDPLDYTIFKDFFEQMLEKQNEQVVLTKA